MVFNINIQSENPLLKFNKNSCSDEDFFNNRYLPVDDNLYGYPSKPLLLLVSLDEVYRDLEGLHRTNLLKSILDVVRKQVKKGFPIIYTGNLEDPLADFLDNDNNDVTKGGVGGFTKLSNKEIDIWKNLKALLLPDNFDEMVNKGLLIVLDGALKGEALRKAVIPLAKQHRCNHIRVGGINETACCFDMARELAPRLWATFVPDIHHPFFRPLEKNEYTSPSYLEAIIDPSISTDKCENTELKYKDLITKKSAWVCYQGVQTQQFDPDCEKFPGAKKLLEELNKLQQTCNVKDEKKLNDNDDSIGDWFCNGVIDLN